jgi:MFS superfamily sulfate permease-like transporter
MRSLAPAIRPYQMSWVRADILAGLAAGAVVIPQAMAYATVANMPVQIGLYTCMLSNDQNLWMSLGEAA